MQSTSFIPQLFFSLLFIKTGDILIIIFNFIFIVLQFKEEDIIFIRFYFLSNTHKG